MRLLHINSLTGYVEYSQYNLNVKFFSSYPLLFTPSIFFSPCALKEPLLASSVYSFSKHLSRWDYPSEPALTEHSHAKLSLSTSPTPVTVALGQQATTKGFPLWGNKAHKSLSEKFLPSVTVCTKTRDSITHVLPQRSLEEVLCHNLSLKESEESS